MFKDCDHEIDEEINISSHEMNEMNEEDGNNFNLDLSESENPSLEIGDSRVRFPRHNLEINRFGATVMSMPEQTLTQFEINPDFIEEKEMIGKGSAGVVWLAEYYINGQKMKVAIKEIPIDTKQSRDQFVNDLRVFLTSDNPCVVQFYGCFYKQGLLNEVIEYMDLGSLRDVIKFNIRQKRALNEGILAEISFCILKGLLYIHQKKQIHRDIKPENILINSNGDVKITDFGISKQLDKTFGLSRTWCGTFIYMSPQRVEGKDYDYKSDVWSFGLVLYELATFQKLPYYKSAKQPQLLVIQRIRNSPVPSFNEQDNRSSEMSDFLSRCLSKNYKQRANVEELLKHPWLVNNINKFNLKQFMKYIGKELKK